QIQRYFDFHLTLKSLNGMTSGELEALSGRWVILSGTVASMRVVNQDDTNFVAEIVLIDGEWDGTEQVYMYQSFLRLEGEQWVSKIPVRRSRRTSPDAIPLNATILAVGMVADPYVDADGYVYPVIHCDYIRIIQ
ncbi:MAG: hypothetical protein JXB03_03775, partial [Spirochaetales bacterium]|nr:hypothetical protein [Spirochaetales bacterium]